MSTLTLKVGSKGVSKGAYVNKRYTDEEWEDNELKLSNLKDQAMIEEIKSKIREDLSEEEFYISYGQDGAYIELVDENTDTHILVCVNSNDHDGNPLYIEGAYDKESDTCKIDINDSKVIAELLTGIAKYREDDEPNILVSEDKSTVTFEENEKMWLDMNLVDAIYTVGLNKEYGTELIDALENCYGTSEFYDNYDEEWGEIEEEVSEKEKDFLKISSLIEKYKGNKIILSVDHCGAVFSLIEVDEYNFNDVSYDISYDVSLLKNEDSDIL